MQFSLNLFQVTKKELDELLSELFDGSNDDEEDTMDLPCPVGTVQLACNGCFELIPTNPMVRSGKSFPIPTQLTVPHDLFSDASFASTVASVESVASQQESAWWKTSTRRG